MSFIKEIFKAFRDEKKMLRGANYLKKKLFKQYKYLVTEISIDLNIYDTPTMIVLHNTITDTDIELITNDVIQGAIADIKKEQGITK